MRSFKVTSLKRLLAATADFGGSAHIAEQQVERIQQRLKRGVDVNGQSFAPFKDERKNRENDRPLENAYRLFDRPDYEVEKTLTGVDVKATLHGLPAKIAIVQNVKRRFLGYSHDDRVAVKEDVVRAILQAFRSWRG